MAPIDRILLSSRTGFSRLSNRRLWNIAKSVFLESITISSHFFSLFPSISFIFFFFFLFSLILYFFFLLCLFFSNHSFSKIRPFYRRQTTYKNSRERRIYHHCWTIFLIQLLSQFRGSIHRLSPILYALILEFNELAVINISDKTCYLVFVQEIPNYQSDPHLITIYCFHCQHISL